MAVEVFKPQQIKELIMLVDLLEKENKQLIANVIIYFKAS